MKQTTETDMKTITLKLVNDNWVATFDNDAEIFELFGTYELPTPFTNLTSRDVVIDTIRTKNPGYEIKAH
jgi:hypothetical protein